jgi:predicted DNA-binding WGR domain protein
MSNANTLEAREFASTPYTWHKGSKYYNLHIQPNLFGGASLIKTWGAKGSKRGGHQIVYCDSEEEARLAIATAVKRRKLRGYRPYDCNKVKTPINELLDLVAKQKGNGSVNRLKQLIRPGADINTQDHEGCTALRWAAYLKNAGIVTALITSGAELNIRCDKGCTPLMESSWKGNIEIVKMLLKHGAEVKVKDNDGHTILEYAHDSNSKEIIELVSKQYTKYALIQKENCSTTIEQFQS